MARKAPANMDTDEAPVRLMANAPLAGAIFGMSDAKTNYSHSTPRVCGFHLLNNDKTMARRSDAGWTGYSEVETGVHVPC